MSRAAPIPSLRSRVLGCGDDALRSGALLPIPTDLVAVEDAGVVFTVRVRKSLARKHRAASGTAGANPFLPYEPALFVADLSDTHLCLLNKYPVTREHVLIITRAFVPQQSPLALEDFEALWCGLGEIDGLGFYNSGPLAGASQPHRHLQLVPGPLGGEGQHTPIDALVEAARFDDAVGVAPGLPFLHAVARLRACETLPAADAARVLHGLYGEMLRAFGCDDPKRPYNLLLTRDWMLFVPRLLECFGGISVNALGFAGSFFVSSEAELDALRRAGPMQVLRHVGVSPRTPAMTETDATPAIVAAALERARAEGFELSCETGVGTLLAALAAGVPPGGRIAELGTGAGVGLAWIVHGLGDRTDVRVTTVELDDALRERVEAASWPASVDFVAGDGAVQVAARGPFELIFADAPGGKLHGLDQTIRALSPGGTLLVDDMDLAEHEDAELREALARVRERILADPRLVASELDASSGIILAARRP